MPAPSSSLINPAIGHLAELTADTAGDLPGLLTVLAGVADPRRRRGVRHRLLVILGLAVCAVLGGARSFTAIAEWAADADHETLARLGVTGAVPSESTFRRTLQRLDADAFDDLAAQLGQVEVGAKTNEIPMFSTLLDRVDVTGAVITADALHAQRDHATYLAGRSAHYLLIVKRNQPGLHAQLASLPWRHVPIAHQARERGHGRTERRTLKVTAVARGLAFPHAARAIQITRRRKMKGKWSRETCYAVTSLTISQASHAQLAAIIRGHWGIEDRLHWVRSPGAGLAVALCGADATRMLFSC